jgi:hypothetical protein
MSASDNLSKNQFELHRGVNFQLAGGKIDKKGAGVHWTPHEDYAEGWAVPALNEGTDEDYFDDDSDPDNGGFNWHKTKGTVIHGIVNRKDVLKPGTKEHWKMADDTASAGNDNELLVRPGSKIKVHKETRLRYDSSLEDEGRDIKYRTRTYKPPRTFTA